MKSALLTLFLVFAVQAAGLSQITSPYYPLQKNFEKEAFFGQPKNIISNYYGNLGTSFLGLVDDPFLNLALNPALLPDQQHFIYTDFSTKQTVSSSTLYYYPADYSSLTVVPNMDRSHNVVQPQATIAYLGRPFSDANIIVGAAYQALYFDEDYYAIPRFTYRDQAGVFSASAIDQILPTDNADKMNQAGHFFTVWGGYEFSNYSIGLKVNRSIFNRTGRSETSYSYFWYPVIFDNMPAVNFLPYPPYGSVQSRNQNYNHWDFTLGTNLTFSEKFSAGISIGFLTSTAKQGLSRNSGSLLSTPPPVTLYSTDDFFSADNSTLSQGWKQNGETWYGSIHGEYKLNDQTSLSLVYRPSWRGNDLKIESLNRGNHFQKNSITYQDTTRFYKSTRNFSTLRNGTGEQSGSNHRLSLLVDMNFSGNSKAFFGIQLGYFNQNYQTTEHINTFRSSFSAMRTEPVSMSDTTRSSLREIKDLNWNYDGYFRTVSLPMMFKASVTGWLGFNAGISPRFVKRRYSDAVIHNFELRETEVNGNVEIRRDFIERNVDQSTEHHFDIPTLIGISLRPSDTIMLRLSTSPIIFRKDFGTYNRSNWQGFFSLTITP